MEEPILYHEIVSTSHYCNHSVVQRSRGLGLRRPDHIKASDCEIFRIRKSRNMVSEKGYSREGEWSGNPMHLKADLKKDGRAINTPPICMLLQGREA